MPTPFMHLHAAHRFLTDDTISPALRAELQTHLGAFLLGNIAPDARVSGGLARTNTHFFDYTPPKIDPPAKITLLERHPELKQVTGQQRALVAGYLAHLAMDVVWADEMMFPYFYAKKWGDAATRFIMLHVLLCHLDARDYRQWDALFPDALALAQPHNWLPFLSDADLVQWRDMIAGQVCAACESQTLAVLGARVTIGETGLGAYLSDEARLEAELWQYVPLAAVAQVEVQMYQTMVQDIVEYMTETA